MKRRKAPAYSDSAFSLAPSEAPKHSRVLNVLDIVNEEAKPIEFILYPWFNRQGLALVFAERGVGKTHFSLNVAHAIARGGHFLKWHAFEPKKVLYIDGEMPFFGIKDRIIMINNMFGKIEDPSNLQVITPDKYEKSIPDLSSPAGQQEIDDHIDQLGSEVLVIDNIACLMPKIKGNDNDSWNLLIQGWLLSLRRRNVSVLIVHHAGKPKKDEPFTGRGSSGKEDVLDTVISLSHPAGYIASEGARFVVQFTKNRHFFGDDAQPFEAWLKEDVHGDSHWLTDNVPDSTYLTVCKMINDGAKQKDVASKLRISKQRVSALTQKGIREAKITNISDQFSY